MENVIKRTARDIMVKDIYTVNSDMPLIDMDKALFKKKISGAPVVDNGKLVGIISRTDISHKLSDEIEAKPSYTTYFWEADGSVKDITVDGGCNCDTLVEKMRGYSVADIMIEEVISVNASDSIKEVAATMVENKIHRVLVVDNSNLVGLISTLDVVKEYANA